MSARGLKYGDVATAAVTSEQDCIDALHVAADRLGESPTKADYEALGLTPASATIQRVMGGWNAAKDAAGLETSASTGSRMAEKPADVELPDGLAWTELSQDQRWHYRHRERNRERTLNRRARHRAWVYEQKARSEGCVRCGEDEPACLDYHHRDDADKEMTVSAMVTYGYSKDKLRSEMEKCTILCANCHRKEHYEVPECVRYPDEEMLGVDE